MRYYIGCDLGGTNLRAGLVDTETGQVLILKSVPTLAREGHEAVIRRMAELAGQLLVEYDCSPADVGGIGVGVPAVLDLEKGLVLLMPNLPGAWTNVALRDAIRERTGIPTELLNDARAITLGEWAFGAGKGSNSMACFAIGTGVGGGLVINGRLHLGSGGTAGELGHQTIDFNGPRCGCGNYGCLETYASGPAIAAAGMKAVAQGLTTIIGALVDYDLNKITPESIYQAARQGDKIALDIFDQAGFALGVAIGNIMVSVSPERVVLCGGVARAADLLIPCIQRTVQGRVTVVPVQQTQFLRGRLGDQAGVLGVAAWVKSLQES
jgi:glucokinase